MNNQNLLKIILLFFFIVSCSVPKSSQDIQVIYENLQGEILKNNIFRNSTIKPLLRGINELYYTDYENEKYYISYFSYRDSSKLRVSSAKGMLNNDIWDKNIREKLQNTISQMIDLNILAIHNDSISTKIFTGYNFDNSNEKYVFVFSKGKLLNIPKNKEIKWLSKTDYVYRTDRYKKLDNIEDVFDPYFIRWLKFN